MIILSGVLVVVAIGLLVAGIVAGGDEGAQVLGVDALMVIYISIAVSIVSALCLAIGVFLRRRELFGSGAAPARARKAKGRAKAGRKNERKSSKGGRQTPAPPAERAGDTKPVAVPAAPARVPDEALVHVVPGRKRYHLSSCRQVAGRDTEELTYVEAREEGFSPCTACMPDTALAARAAASPAGPDAKGGKDAGSGKDAKSVKSAPDAKSAKGGQDAEDAKAEDAKGGKDAAGRGEAARPGDGPTGAGQDAATVPSRPGAFAGTAGGATAAEAPERPSPGGPSSVAAAAAAAPAAPAPSAPSPVPSAWAPPASPRPTVTDQPVPEQARPEPAGDASGGGGPDSDPEVRILSGTRRYHRSDCALIEDIGDQADDLEALPLSQAQARGCTPCLVCQPDKTPAR